MPKLVKAVGPHGPAEGSTHLAPLSALSALRGDVAGLERSVRFAVSLYATAGGDAHKLLSDLLRETPKKRAERRGRTREERGKPSLEREALDFFARCEREGFEAVRAEYRSRHSRAAGDKHIQRLIRAMEQRIDRMSADTAAIRELVSQGKLELARLIVSPRDG